MKIKDIFYEWREDEFAGVSTLKSQLKPFWEGVLYFLLFSGIVILGISIILLFG